MRNIDPDSQENKRQARENKAEVSTLKFLHENPKECAVRISKDWANVESLLMHQIARCLGVMSAEFGPFLKRDGKNWQLDSSNDWWAHLEGQELTLTTRYRDKKLKALADYVEAFMGVEK